jgi:hypothetical protein
MKRRVVPALTLTAGLAAAVYIVVVVAAAAVGSFAVKAEPLLLTSSQMEAVTAGLTVIAGNVTFTQNLNLTNQTAAGVAVAVATCGVCSGKNPAANAAAAAANANLTGQSIRQ